MEEQLKEHIKLNPKIIKTGLSQSQIETLNGIIYRAPSLPPQNSQDWIPSMKPAGQSLKKYITDLNSKKFNKFGAIGLNTIYITPLNGDLSYSFLKTCANFIQSYYFGSIVKINKPIDISKVKSIKKRKNQPQLQYNANDILNYLQRSTQKDAFCTIAITSLDLYHKQSWNFIFGLGRLRNRVGVFSFARYDPRFYNASLYQLKDEDEIEQINKIVQYRSCKVMVHQIGHMFGLKHCIYYACLMQGSMNDQEADKKPLFLCPVCLLKLRQNMQFDIKQRARAIADNLMKMKNQNISQFLEWYQAI